MNYDTKSNHEQTKKDKYLIESFFTESVDINQILKKMLEQKLRHIKIDYKVL